MARKRVSMPKGGTSLWGNTGWPQACQNKCTTSDLKPNPKMKNDRYTNDVCPTAYQDIKRPQNQRWCSRWLTWQEPSPQWRRTVNSNVEEPLLKSAASTGHTASLILVCIWWRNCSKRSGKEKHLPRKMKSQVLHSFYPNSILIFLSAFRLTSDTSSSNKGTTMGILLFRIHMAPTLIDIHIALIS